MEILADLVYYPKGQIWRENFRLDICCIKIIRENSYCIDPTDPIFVCYVAGLPDTTTK